MRVKSYLSNLKWLGISLNRLVTEVENWAEVLVYYVSPLHRSPLKIRLRNGDILTAPEDYVFEAISETLLLNVYGLEKPWPGNVIVDIGASVGDFALRASKNPDARVYAFEPSPRSFKYMESNLHSNGRRNVRLFNAAADGQTLDSIIDTYGESSIDFLKIDCEGCEYELLHCSNAVLANVREISMEVHSVGGHTADEIPSRLREVGFRVIETKRFGQGRYIHATNRQSLRTRQPHL